MKGKLWAVVFCFTVLFSLVACKSEDSGERPEVSSQSRTDLSSSDTASVFSVSEESGQALSAEELSILEAYLTIVDQIYQVDKGLNDQISIIAFDTSKMENLTETIKPVFFQQVEEIYGYTVMDSTYDQLIADGYIIMDDPAGYFKDGILITINDQPIQGNQMEYHVEKWRSGLGAYFYRDCTLKQTQDGWIVASVGAEMIS